MGRRGQRPVYYECSAGVAQQLVATYPGVAYHGQGVSCAWDMAEIVAHKLGVPAPTVPASSAIDLPGLPEYRRLIPADMPRTYQKEDALFLVRRAYALLCNPMRSGKSFECLMAASLAGVQRGLILCPSIAKWVWAAEIAKRLGKAALLLDGLSCSEARLYCLRCDQRGRLNDGSRCADCRARNGQSYGYVIYETRQTEPPTKQQALTSDLWRCRKHVDFTSSPDAPTDCELCRAELAEVLRTADYVICNYDLVTPRATRDARGRTHMQHQMRGWETVLSRLDFDLAILDECHYLRTFTTTYAKMRTTRAAIVKRIVRGTPIVWGVTGTPIFGFVRDLYGQLDVVSDGLFGDSVDFTRRYCGGYKDTYGWVADGRTNEAELVARLRTLKIQRPRSEILSQMPRKQRSVFRIEDARVRLKRRRNGSPKGHIAKNIAAIAHIKRPYVVEHVMNELSEGLKTYVLTYRRNACEAMAKAIEAEIQKREWRSRMRAQNAEVWVGQTEAGISAKARLDAARAFCEHQGAAVFVATIDSMPGSLSLAGATSVHMADWHTSPSAMEQAEDRPFEVGTTGLSITHYVVAGSIDEDLEAIVLPKFEAKDKLLNDENAQDMLSTFRALTEDETIDEVWRRHTAHLVDEDEED